MEIKLLQMLMVAAIYGRKQVEGNESMFFLYSDAVHDTVGTLAMDSAKTEYCLPENYFQNPTGIAYDFERGTVYVLDEHVGVFKFLLDGHSLPEKIFDIDQGVSLDLYSLALDGEGHIFITDVDIGKIFRINVNGTDPVDWVEGLNRPYGVAVDTRNRYLIWSDFNTGTMERASLDQPKNNRTILQIRSRPLRLHIDITATEEKLYWCEYGGSVLMANTDGTDIQEIIDLGNIYLWDIIGYGGHLYVTGAGNPFIIYDIYNGSYTVIVNTTTWRSLGIEVVTSQIADTVCHASCYNGGTFVESNRTCYCVQPWAGIECNYCYISCQNGGMIENDTCTCACLSLWRGDRCDNCDVICQNGGTLDADICTCDCVPQWSGDECKICDMICKNGGTLDSDICKCDCLPQWSGDECEILQQPIPSKNSPEITSSSPSFGPAAGGTWITMTGTNFLLEYNMSITIADTTCDTKLQNTTTVIGITRGLHKNDIDIIGTPLPVSLNANNTVIINSSYEFTYKPNPVISKVFPKETIIKGGTLLTVDGDYLDSVAVIWMEVIMVLKTLKSEEPLAYDETRTTYATKCQVASKTRMYCPTPILDIPPSFLDQLPQFTQTKRDVYHRTKLRRKKKERRLDIFSSLSENPSRRMKRDTVKLEFSKDGDILEFYIGFRLDGVRDYENYTTIDIYSEPTFDFQSSTAIIFKAGERLSFNGEGLDIGITSYDYRITIGLEDCEDLELVSNSLSCYPPQSKPEMDEDDKGDPQVIIHVGLNVQHLAGYLRYPDPGRAATDTKLPLYIMIPATVVPAIVVIIVIAAVCATQRRRSCCQRQE